MNALIELIKKAQGDRSQNEYALHSGVSSAAITRILTGGRQPSPDTLRKLAEHAYNGVTYQDLMIACGYLDAAGAKAARPDRDGVTLDELEFALFGEVRELDDEEKEELLRNARRMNEVRKLRNKKPEEH